MLFNNVHLGSRGLEEVEPQGFLNMFKNSGLEAVFPAPKPFCLVLAIAMDFYARETGLLTPNLNLFEKMHQVSAMKTQPE